MIPAKGRQTAPLNAWMGNCGLDYEDEMGIMKSPASSLHSSTGVSPHAEANSCAGQERQKFH